MAEIKIKGVAKQLWRFLHRAALHRPARSSRSGVHGPARRLRVRQDHAPCGSICGLDFATEGRGLDRRPQGRPPAAARARHRDGVPELRGVPASHRVREYRLRPAHGQEIAGRSRSKRRSERTAGLMHIEQLLERYSGAALWRPAPARCGCTRAWPWSRTCILMDEPLSNLDALLRIGDARRTQGRPRRRARPRRSTSPTTRSRR